MMVHNPLSEKKHIYRVLHDKEQDNASKETQKTHPHKHQKHKYINTFSCTKKRSTDLI